MPAKIILGLLLLSPVEFKLGYALMFPKCHGLSFIHEIPVEELLTAANLSLPLLSQFDILKEMLSVGVCGYLSDGGHSGRGWLVAVKEE